VTDNHAISVTFVHPTDSSQSLLATIGSESTPQYLISELIAEGFIAAVGKGTWYKLVDARTNTELPDHVSLAESGVASGSTLMIMSSVSGASEGI
jgi:hypothetical protein